LRISAPGSRPASKQDLEAVAHADDVRALLRLLAHGLHDRHARGNGAAAQVVAIGKAAGDDDQVDVIIDRGLGLPHGLRGLARNPGQCRDHVAVAVEAGQEDDGGFHGSEHLDREILDHRIGEQFLAHGLEFGLGLGAVGGFKNHIEDLALSDGIDAGKTKAAERMLDGLALRVENAVLERDSDACLDH
jgi:hypothetical protein